ncbi:fungal specific transcription factor domain-containing protein [Candidatus Bathyarchaeota archaeon]|nr:fungal specific transcription factor domain-containing protein [Candidatus Bathyarchaeota archaeon]
MIMGRVVEVLYGSNLGCDDPQDVFTLASQVLQIEQQLSKAQRTFPSTLQLIEPHDLVHGPGSSSDALLKFRVIYTLRYHNLRILMHRPLLHRYLEVLSSQAGDVQQIAPLGQVGVNSLRTCVQSASSIVELMSRLSSSTERVRELSGAWWFSLFYSKALIAPSYRENETV